MATVSGVWVWNQFISGDDFNQDVSFTETTLWGNMKGDNTSDGYELRYGATGGTNYVLAYSDEVGGWQRSNLVIDFGSSEQTVTDTFYTFLTANATQQASPAVPTPDWAKCFVKTSSGNKAVEKVWIKQNGQLITVYEAETPRSFATDTWAQISVACQDGTYKTLYAVGDTKDIELSTGETITVAIMGFDHDDLSEGGKAPITLGMTELLANKYQMNETRTNVGGWPSSKMYTEIMPALLSQLPTDLQQIVHEVNKKTRAGGNSTSGSVTASVNKLFLFGRVEVDGYTNALYINEGEQYEYWKTVKDGDLNADRVKRLSNGEGDTSVWLLRTPTAASSTTFQSFNFNGADWSSGGTSLAGVSFGFCVG